MFVCVCVFVYLCECVSFCLCSECVWLGVCICLCVWQWLCVCVSLCVSLCVPVSAAREMWYWQPRNASLFLESKPSKRKGSGKILWNLIHIWMETNSAVSFMHQNLRQMSLLLGIGICNSPFWLSWKYSISPEVSQFRIGQAKITQNERSQKNKPEFIHSDKIFNLQ